MKNSNPGTRSIGSISNYSNFNVPQKGNTENDIQHVYLMKLFVEELEDIYWAEKALTQAIPMMILKATSSKLIDALENHLVETKEHVKRVEKVFGILGKKALAKQCEAIKSLIKETEGFTEGKMVDAGIIATGQKIKLYEIATYGILLELAVTLGLLDAIDLLQTTLDEETAAEEKLTEVFLFTETFRQVKKNPKHNQKNQYVDRVISRFVESEMGIM